MNRRAFFATLAAGLAATVDPERLLWVPGKKVISIPRPALDFSAITIQENWWYGKDGSVFYHIECEAWSETVREAHGIIPVIALSEITGMVKFREMTRQQVRPLIDAGRLLACGHLWSWNKPGTPPAEIDCIHCGKPVISFGVKL